MGVSGTKIVAFGGSVVGGTSAKLDVFHDCFQYESTTVNMVRGTQTWWSVLQRILCDWVDGGVEIINAGLEGDTIGKALARLDRDVLSRSPHCVLVMFGPEDVLAGTDPEAFQDGLEKMAEAIRVSNAKPVLMTPPPFSERMTVQGLTLDEVRQRQERLAHLAEITRGISRTRSVCVIDLHRYFLENRLAYDHLFQGWLPDGVAQSAIASFVAAEITKVLGATGPPKPALTDYRKIYSNPDEPDWKHHAFTDLTYFEGAFYVAFREGYAHCPPPPPSGRIIVLRSADGVLWDKETVLQVPNVENSVDPKFLAVDGRLFVYTACCLSISQRPVAHATFGFERLGPRQWSTHFECARSVFWRPRKWRGQYLVAAYDVPDKSASVGLYSSADGRTWRLTSRILPCELDGDETDLWVEDDALVAYSRTAGGMRCKEEMLISTYIPSQHRWETVSSGRIVQAPCVFKACGKALVAGRYCAQSDERYRELRHAWAGFNAGSAEEVASIDPALVEEYHHNLRTGIFLMDGTRPRLVMELLSAGDCGYSGVLQYGREYVISDYSMHEYYRPVKNPRSWGTPADIYVSRIRLGE